MDFADIANASPLILLVAPSDAAAKEFLVGDGGALAAESWADWPVFAWSPNKGVEHVRVAEDEADLAAGDHAHKAEGALAELQGLDAECFLILFHADQVRNTAKLRMLLAKQCTDKDIVPKLILVAQDGEHWRNFFLDSLKLDAAPFTHRLDAGPRRATRPAGASPSGDLREVENLDTFDTPEWTARLNELPLRDLFAILNQGIHNACVERVRNLRAALGRVFVGKDDLINLMTECTVSHLPMIMLGTWGTGKSMLVRKMAEGLGIYPKRLSIGAEDDLVRGMLGSAPGEGTPAQFDEAADRRHFEYLVTRFTTPEELLGAVNIELMLQRALYVRQTRGLLPRAEIAFLDEVFKANSSILNALLSIINERLFYNAGLPWTVNLVMLFGASNEPPQEEELGAFYDRFPVRCLCDPVDNMFVERLLELAHTHAVAALLPPSPSREDYRLLDPTDEPNIVDESRSKLRARTMTRMACVNDFRLLNKVCLATYGGLLLSDGREKGEAFKKTYLHVFTHLRHEYDISDRSCAHFYRLARARALLAARDWLEPTDVEVLKYAGKDPEQLRRLQSIVSSLL